MSRPATVLAGPIRAYRLISAVTLPRCRFWPSCSSYALTALERHGARRGVWMALRRVASCHPWSAGGVDEVPGRDRAAGPVAPSQSRACA